MVAPLPQCNVQRSWRGSLEKHKTNCVDGGEAAPGTHEITIRFLLEEHLTVSLLSLIVSCHSKISLNA